MIISMTGFGRSKKELEDYSLTVEIRTVNHRFLDFHIRIPHQLNHIEDQIRKQIKQYIKRGRVDCYITIEGGILSSRHLTIDWALIDEYYQFISTLKNTYGFDEQIHLNDLLNRHEFITITEKDEDQDSLEPIILATVEEALLNLTEMRKVEGEEIKKDLDRHLSQLKERLKEVQQKVPILQQNYQERLTKKLAEATNGIVDETRLLTEVSLFVDKADISEEIARLQSHIQQVQQSLNVFEPVGRKLDFLIQEMNREVNTMGSKANDSEISIHVVEMKSILEKLKEQVQNVE